MRGGDGAGVVASELAAQRMSLGTGYGMLLISGYTRNELLMDVDQVSGRRSGQRGQGWTRQGIHMHEQDASGSKR